MGQQKEAGKVDHSSPSQSGHIETRPQRSSVSEPGVSGIWAAAAGVEGGGRDHQKLKPLETGVDQLLPLATHQSH